MFITRFAEHHSKQYLTKVPGGGCITDSTKKKKKNGFTEHPTSKNSELSKSKRYFTYHWLYPEIKPIKPPLTTTDDTFEVKVRQSICKMNYIVRRY